LVFMLALYVHIPFCLKKCFYCSFPVVVGKTDKAALYLSFLKREARNFFGQTIGTVYLGGGTPTELRVRDLEDLCAWIRTTFILPKTAEWTVEMNPEGVSDEKLSVLRAFGVNRVSLGAQSFQDSFLRSVGRVHREEDIYRAYRLIRKAGWDNVNVDMMYGLPGQDIGDFQKDLNRLMSLDPDHVSVYALTPEEGSRFYTRGQTLPSTTLQAEQYRYLVVELEHRGWAQYEVSNFARQGKLCVHNRHYWRGGNYLGLGLGAHSHRNGHRYWNTDRWPVYIDRMRRGLSVRGGEEFLNPAQRQTESLVFGLRMNEGVCLRELARRFQRPLREDQIRFLSEAIALGWLSRRGDRVQTTLNGRLVLDGICRRLM